MGNFLAWTGFYTIKYIVYFIIAIGGVMLGKVWADHSAKKKAVKVEEK